MKLDIHEISFFLCVSCLLNNQQHLRTDTHHIAFFKELDYLPINRLFFRVCNRVAVNLGPPCAGPLRGQITVKSPGFLDARCAMPKRGAPADTTNHWLCDGDQC